MHNDLIVLHRLFAGYFHAAIYSQVEPTKGKSSQVFAGNGTERQAEKGSKIKSLLTLKHHRNQFFKTVLQFFLLGWS